MVAITRCRIFFHALKRCNQRVIRMYCTKGKDESPEDKKEKSEFPEAPTTCCMSGCANCVWVEYAEQLTKYFKDGGSQAIKEIEEKVTDPNIKAFILQELRSRTPKSD